MIKQNATVNYLTDHYFICKKAALTLMNNELIRLLIKYQRFIHQSKIVQHEL